MSREPGAKRCYWDGCVATWKHWHGFLPGGYNAPDDPEGQNVPILFTDPAPELPPGWCRDDNGAPLGPPSSETDVASSPDASAMWPKTNLPTSETRTVTE